jgi:hypothetical protein
MADLVARTITSTAGISRDPLRRRKMKARTPSQMGETRPITLQQYERFQFMRDALAKGGVTIPLPTDN